jgi:glycosyltransferase involved in cell wall biosynthesis
MAHALFARELTRRPPDIVHAQGGYIPTLQRALVLSARRRGVPVVLTPHNAFPRSSRPAARRSFRRLLESADHLVLFARSDLAALEGLGGALPPRSILPFGVLDFFSRSRGSGRVVRERLGIPSGALVLLSFGHLRRDKRLDLLLDALATGEGLGAVWLLVAGDPGREAGWLREAIAVRGLEGRVRTDLRYIEAHEGGTFFDAADIVVLPYAIASQSAALYAAVACERPVVAAAVGGLGEVLADGTTAYLVRPGDAEALADGIRRAIADGEEGRLAVAARARETVGRGADWERSAGETRRIYEALILRRGLPDGRPGSAKR